MGRAWSHHGSKRRRCGYLTFLTFDLAGEYVTMNKILRLQVALVIMVSFSFLNSARGAEEPEAQGPSDRKIQLAGGALTLEAPKSWEKKKPRFNIIEYEFIAKNSNRFKIFFDKNSFEFKGWETKDAYSNVVNFSIINLEENIVIENDFFRIPEEKDL